LMAAARFEASVSVLLLMAKVTAVVLPQLFVPSVPALGDAQAKRDELIVVVAEGVLADPFAVAVTVTALPLWMAVAPTAENELLQALIAAARSPASWFALPRLLLKVPAVEFVGQEFALPLPPVKVSVFDPTVILTLPLLPGAVFWKVPTMVPAVGLGVKTSVPSVALPVPLPTFPEKVPVCDAFVGVLAVTPTELAPFVTVTVSPPTRLLAVKVPVSLAVVDAPL